MNINQQHQQKISKMIKQFKKTQQNKPNNTEAPAQMTPKATFLTREVTLVEGRWRHFTYMALLCIFVRPRSKGRSRRWVFVGTIPGLKAGKSKDLSSRFEFVSLYSTPKADVCYRWRVIYGWKCTNENVACSLEQWIISLLRTKGGWMGMWRAKIHKKLSLTAGKRALLESYISKSESFCPVDQGIAVNYQEIISEIKKDGVVKGMMKSGKCTALTPSEVGVVFKAESGAQ